MEPNKLLGSVLLLTGVADIVLAQVIGAKLSSQVRLVIQIFGAGFVILGSMLSLGVFKIV